MPCNRGGPLPPVRHGCRAVALRHRSCNCFARREPPWRTRTHLAVFAAVDTGRGRSRIVSRWQGRLPPTRTECARLALCGCLDSWFPGILITNPRQKRMRQASSSANHLGHAPLIHRRDVRNEFDLNCCRPCFGGAGISRRRCGMMRSCPSRKNQFPALRFQSGAARIGRWMNEHEVSGCCSSTSFSLSICLDSQPSILSRQD